MNTFGKNVIYISVWLDFNAVVFEDDLKSFLFTFQYD